jgi:F-type H+-transporting ATPase subunit a
VHEEHGSWLSWLYAIKIGSHHLVPEWVPEAVPMAVLVVLVLGVLVRLGMRRPQREPAGLQNVIEWVFGGLENTWRGVLGDHAPRFAPFLSTLFIYILLMNWLGLVPGFKSPTANLNTTVALALVVFLVVQAYGVKENGFIGYAKHFTGDVWWLAPLMFPIHVIGELARPLSLSLRLYGNVSGEDTIIMVLVALGTTLFHRGLAGMTEAAPYGLAAPMIALALFTSMVQAYIFSLLASVYLAGVVHGHGEEHAPTAASG